MCWEKLWSSIGVLVWSNTVRVMDTPVVDLIGVKSILKEGLVSNTVAAIAMASSIVASRASVRTSSLKAIEMRETAFSWLPRCCCSVRIVMCTMEFMTRRSVMRRSMLGNVMRW